MHLSVNFTVPLLAAVVGGVGHLVVTNGKLSELCRLTFGCGMLALLVHW